MSEPDELLVELFSEARAPTGSDEFVASVAARIGRARLRGTLARIGSVAALAALALAATPYIAEQSLVLGDRIASALPALGNALASPLGWVGGSLIALWYLRRLRLLGR